MLIEADNNLENSDWIKARTWDLPYENLEQYLRAYAPADQREAVQHLMSLPAFKAAPPMFRVEAEMFVAGSALKYVAGEFIVKFDDEQERDENGRWTSTGGGSMPYTLTPQPDNKYVARVISDQTSFYDLARTPEESVKAFLAVQVDKETAENRLWAIVREPDAPQLPVTREQIEASVKAYYANSTRDINSLDDLTEEQRPFEIDRAINEVLGSEAAQEYRLAQIDYVQNKMDDMVLPDGRTVSDTMNLMADDSLKLLQEMAQTAPVSLTMPDSRLAKFLGDERYKTVFEVSSPEKGAARSLYLEAREATETKLGVPDGTAPEDRPVYATLGGTGSAYGNATITMDDSLKERTTITIGDSIDGAVTGYFNMGQLAAGTVSREEFWQNIGDRVSLWSSNQYVSTWWDYTSDFQISGYAGVKDITEMGVNHYLEAQIHGGLSLSNVTSITVNPDYKISGPNQAKLDSLGITVDRKQSTWTKD